MSRSIVRLGVISAISVAFIAVESASRAAVRVAPRANQPPIITVELPPNPGYFYDGNVVRMTVRVIDPDGDLVTAVMDGAIEVEGFRPIVAAPSGTSREIVWYTSSALAGHNELVITAWDDAEPAVHVRHRESLLVLGTDRGRRIAFHDLDGDGDDELFAAAYNGDVIPVHNAGAIALFDQYGVRGPGMRPSLLTAATPASSGQVGWSIGGGIQIADVTGDGRPDLIARDATALLVWSAPDPAASFTGASATLKCSDPTSGFYGGATDWIVVDVTNDGVADVIAVASGADVNGVVDAGEICVFAGGPGMTGTPAPMATLHLPNAVAGDQLGLVRIGWYAQGLLIGDVTGDGVADVVACASQADRPGFINCGRLFVWEGGAALTGSPAPTATLDALSTKGGDMLGYDGTGEGVFLVDVTGDGVRDVVAACPEVGAGGSLFLWHGGATLAGSIDATAQLRQATPQAGDGVGRTGAWGEGIQFVDLNSDGIQDVLACATFADVNGQKNAGALFYWPGGNLSGLVFQSAILQRAVPVKHDDLAQSRCGLQFADVTGDGQLDVVTISPNADGAAIDSGVIDVWQGGAGFSGTVTPTAELQVSGAVASDLLGVANGKYAVGACGMLLVDVTGDGVNDVIAVGSQVDVGGVSDAGAAYVWAGGAGLTGGAIVAPSARLSDPAPVKDELLGYRTQNGCAVHAGDVDGDGVLDVVLLATSDPSYRNPPASVRAKVFTFAGGAAMAGNPAPSLTGTSPQDWDGMGNFGEECFLADVNCDFKADVVTHVPAHERFVHGAQAIGAIYVFFGRSTGVVQPMIFRNSIAAIADGDDSWIPPPEDIDGDSRIDLVIVQPFADSGTIRDVGQLLLWRDPLRGNGNGRGFVSLPPGGFGPAPQTDPEIATPELRLGTYANLGR